MSNLNSVEILSPGSFLQEEMDVRGWTSEYLATIMGREINNIDSIIAGLSEIDIETAQSLAETFGTSAAYWSNLQARYSAYKAS